MGLSVTERTFATIASPIAGLPPASKTTTPQSVTTKTEFPSCGSSKGSCRIAPQTPVASCCHEYTKGLALTSHGGQHRTRVNAPRTSPRNFFMTASHSRPKGVRLFLTYVPSQTGVHVLPPSADVSAVCRILSGPRLVKVIVTCTFE